MVEGEILCLNLKLKMNNDICLEKWISYHSIASRQSELFSKVTKFDTHAVFHLSRSANLERSYQIIWHFGQSGQMSFLMISAMWVQI